MRILPRHHDLAAAQEAKLDLICRKLQLGPRDRVLDIGCGWGGFARFAAERYGVHVTGITISTEQLAYARELTRGLDVDLRRLDYRDLTGQFDKIVVCGMIEHVGHKNYRAFMEIVERSLAPDGLFLLHTIGSNNSVRSMAPWLDKHIFPNSMLPSIAQLGAASEDLQRDDVPGSNRSILVDRPLTIKRRGGAAAGPRRRASPPPSQRRPQVGHGAQGSMTHAGGQVLPRALAQLERPFGGRHGREVCQGWATITTARCSTRPPRSR